jgi:hypothetical protein
MDNSEMNTMHQNDTMDAESSYYSGNPEFTIVDEIQGIPSEPRTPVTPLPDYSNIENMSYAVRITS